MTPSRGQSVVASGRTRLCVALAALSAFAPAVAAQSRAGDYAATPPSRRHAQLFTLDDAYLAASFGAATIALIPVDRRTAVELQEPGAQVNRFFRGAATGFRVLGSPGSLLIGSALYAVGRAGHQPTLADLGLHSTEAIVLGGGVTGLVKGLAGRARPYVSSDTNPRDYRLGRGFRRSGDYASFPSGHTTAAFAAAAAVTSEASRRWSRSVWYVAPLMYGSATMVGLSRMYNNKHWASDVVVGAAVGTFSGIKVVRYNHGHPDNRLDRLLLRPTAAPGEGGGAIVWTVPW